MKKTLEHNIGRRIKAAREEKHLTQEKLAEATGFSTVYVSEIENKKSVPSFAALCSICEILNISLDSLVSDLETDEIKEITVLLARCNDKQLKVIRAMVETLLQAELYS